MSTNLEKKRAVRTKSRTKAKIENTKESPGRSMAKAISWRVMGSMGTFLISFVIFRRFTNQSLSEVLGNATFVTILEVVFKILLYYLHERLWTNIKWGKYWRKNYWTRKAWRRMYREMHEKRNAQN